jgi:hypothetical protein
MSEYYLDLRSAKIAGFYIPELEVVYLRHENFNIPHTLVLDYGD